MTMIQASNPFFEKYSTPYGTVPFNLIKTEHYAPAIHEGIRRQNAEIDAIINNTATPTFENTIVPYEKSGELLQRVNTVFGNLLSAETSDELQELAREIMPLMSEHSMTLGPRQTISPGMFSGSDDRIFTSIRGAAFPQEPGLKRVQSS